MNMHIEQVPPRARFEFADHPWVSIFAFWVFTAILMFTFVIIENTTGYFNPGTGFLLAVMVVAPLGMRIPRTNQSYHEHLDQIRLSKPGSSAWHAILALVSYYRDYLDVIRLTRVKPLIPLIVMGLTCWLILAFSQALGTIVFRLTQGLPLTQPFLLDTLSITEDLPPQSMSLFHSFGSVFEEIAWRGIFLSLFLSLFSKKKAVLMAAFGFSGLHLLNLLGDQSTIWVLGQLVWSFALGLWYGYSVLKTDSMIPAMMVHWLGNSFIWSITHYLQTNATPDVQAIYGVIFSLGIVPAVLLFLWVRFLSKKWPVFREVTDQI